MLGIGIISYNRLSSVLYVLERVIEYTRSPFILVVADDGSSDGSCESIKELGHIVISGRNMGVCWNKNRALFYLNCIKRCSSIILLEDDSWPTRLGWEEDWIQAIGYYGHINLAGVWFAELFLSGSGTPQDPVFSHAVSGQCTGYSAEALSYVGYLDTRFRGYGVGHVEHSRRFLRTGYGGLFVYTSAGVLPKFLLLKSDIKVTDSRPQKDEQQIKINERLFLEVAKEPVFRAAWRTDDELVQFRSEIQDARSIEQSRPFDENFYLKTHEDVALAVMRKDFRNGEQHYQLHGRYESRLARIQLEDGQATRSNADQIQPS